MLRNHGPPVNKYNLVVQPWPRDCSEAFISPQEMSHFDNENLNGISIGLFTVHPTDNTRLDLIIPGEAHFYVKAATPQERQQWLVALGTSKAGLHAQNGFPAVISGKRTFGL